jgi:hypothetical protein
MIQVFLAKRLLKKRKPNGQREHRWALRWEDAGGWHCESTGTADKVQAETLRKAKWAEVNKLVPPKEELIPEPSPRAASWRECRDALERAMTADNLRPSSISDAVMLLDLLKRMFPEAETPADITSDMANEWKRRRAEVKASPWTIRSDLSGLKSIFGKWLVRECGLLLSNPFANVRAPKCDDPDVRIISLEENQSLFGWFNKRWNNWRLPLVYLEVATLLGWRATEIASIRSEDILDDGFVRVAAQRSKTRKHKFGWLPKALHDELRSCSADGWAFGRFADELRRRLILIRRRPHHAAKVKDFAPDRFVGWLQDELQRFNVDHTAKCKETDREWQSFTLHDFRRSAITSLQMAGVSEKEASIMVGATPEVIRRHYEKLDQLAIAKRSVQRRLLAEGIDPGQQSVARPLRADGQKPLDDHSDGTQTVSA